MPTPLELLLHPVSLTVFAIYGALIAWEAILPARTLPTSPWWRTRGLVGFFAFFFLSSYLPLLWTEQLVSYQWFDLTLLGTWGGALVAVVVYELAVYVWHRSMHASNGLWRLIHQLHHSAERLDAWGAFWSSPLDMIGWTVVLSLCLTLGMGLTAEATAVVIYITTFFSVFQHTNVRTPRWLGYVIQRPESHSHHHQRGVHAMNYSDLPIFDLLFGTWRNPERFAPTQGFHDGASLRVQEMLLFRDVSKPREQTDCVAESTTRYA
ncbi:MAG: sterol desaturase family protein [Panacagrimonas sp.]